MHNGPEQPCGVIEPSSVTIAWRNASGSASGWYTQIEHGLEDPRYVTLIKLNLRAGDLEPDDPRVEEIATALAGHFIAEPSLLPALTGLQARDDGAIRHELLSHHGEDHKPAWARMTALIEAKLRSAGIDIP